MSVYAESGLGGGWITAVAPQADGDVLLAVGVPFGRTLIEPPSPDVLQGVHRLDASGRIVASVGGPAGFADGNGADGGARFYFPTGVAMRPDGAIVVADTFNNRLRLIDAALNVTTLAGADEAGSADGAVDIARFDQPSELVLDNDGALWLVDERATALRRISADGNVVTVFRSSGTASLTIGASAEPGEVLAIEATRDSRRLMRINASGEATTLVTAVGGCRDGPRRMAQFDAPTDIVESIDGYIYVADDGNQRVRAIDRAGWTSTVLGGDNRPVKGCGHVTPNDGEPSLRDALAIATQADGTLYVIDGCTADGGSTGCIAHARVLRVTR